MITDSTFHAETLARFVEDQPLRVILIGGTSHTGESTRADAWAAQLGWSHRSTDWLARHPGCHWRTPPKSVPEHVSAHYRSLSVEELDADVLRPEEQADVEIECTLDAPRCLVNCDDVDVHSAVQSTQPCDGAQV